MPPLGNTLKIDSNLGTKQSLAIISERSAEEYQSTNLHSERETDIVDDDVTQLSLSIETRYEYIFEEDVGVKELKAKQIFDRVFVDINAKFYVPSVEEIHSFCMNILLTAKMEKEIAIICLVYLEKLMIKTGYIITPRNWRRLTISSLILGSKIWDDESFENHNFAKVFNLYTTEEVNEMERMLLERIDYDLEISTADYTKYYFVIRQFCRDDKKGATLRPLAVETVMNLQNKKLDANKNML